MKIKYSAILDSNAALKAVEQNCYALQFVKDPTEDVCLKAVEKDGYLLRYVKDPSAAVCLKAVEQNGYALQFVLSEELFIAIAEKLNISIEI